MIRILFGIVALSLSACLAAEPIDSKPLFASDAPLAITLIGPLKAIARDRAADPEYRPAELSFAGADGTATRVPIELRARGKSRRSPDACDFPPLRLNLPKEGIEGTVFAGQNKLKLVTQCKLRDRGDRYQQFILKEFGIYKAFNIITPLSFRARMVEVTYVEGDNTLATSFGFFIEDKDDVAARNGLQVVDVQELATSDLDPEQANRAELFQFLIGNTDFSFRLGPGKEPCCHNAVPMLGADGKYRPVPYDFDATGIVDPPYSMPVEQLNISNVRQRLYRGHCEPMDVFEKVLVEFRNARSQISAAMLDQAGLSEGTTKTMGKYIDGFYAVIDDPKRLDKDILRLCRK